MRCVCVCVCVHADSAAECAAPLLVSSQVRVVLTALDVVTTSTQTLASMREVEDAFKVVVVILCRRFNDFAHPQLNVTCPPYL